MSGTVVPELNAAIAQKSAEKAGSSVRSRAASTSNARQHNEGDRESQGGVDRHGRNDVEEGRDAGDSAGRQYRVGHRSSTLPSREAGASFCGVCCGTAWQPGGGSICGCFCS